MVGTINFCLSKFETLVPLRWRKNVWQRWDSNPRPFGLVPKTSALDHSATLPRIDCFLRSSKVVALFAGLYLKDNILCLHFSKRRNHYLCIFPPNWAWEMQTNASNSWEKSCSCNLETKEQNFLHVFKTLLKLTLFITKKLLNKKDAFNTFTQITALVEVWVKTLDLRVSKRKGNPFFLIHFNQKVLFP